MPSFRIQIAGCVAEVNAMFDSTERFCAAFRCEISADFGVTISPEDIAFEREKSARENVLEGLPERQYPDFYLETIAVQRKIAEKLFDYDVLLFHGSVVAVDGLAYLFTAKSGTGKSTHTRLWREVFGNRVTVINDDKPFLQIKNGQAIACGSPWNGKHGLGENVQVPLRAICILERGDKNRIEEIKASEAVFMLLQQSNRPLDRGKMPRYLDLMDQLSRAVRFYRLECNMEQEAAWTAYETMSK